MAPSKKVGEKKAEFATVEQFNGLESTMKSLVDVVTKLAERLMVAPAPATPEEIKKDKEVSAAGPNTTPVNTVFEAKAKEILGDQIERCEMLYQKNGGSVFTVVVKKEFSNAPKDYLEMYKIDNRTVNIERDEFRGEDGVERYAKLVLQNLNRAK